MSHDIVTTINYYDDPGDGSPPMPVYVGKTQVVNERPMIATQVTVSDVTGHEDDFTLDNNGFAYHRHTSAMTGFHDEESIKFHYFPECEELMKQLTGASRVIVFDYKVRRGPSYWHKLGHCNTKSRGPLHRAHVDQSYDGAVLRLRESFPDEAAHLMARRWQIINLWRPIKPIRKDPLALADACTVSDSDLVEATIFYPNSVAKSWTVKPNSMHRWYYKHGQMPDQIALIKCFDSEDTVAKRTPHCAFEDPATAAEESRESIEVRCLLLY